MVIQNSKVSAIDGINGRDRRHVRCLAAHRPYQRLERCVTLDVIDEIDRIPRSRFPARRTENFVHRQVGFVQPESEFGIVLGREETSACLFVVEPLDQRLLAAFSEEHLDKKVVVDREDRFVERLE